MAEKKVLLVEGKDDEHVVKNICGRFRIGKIDAITPTEGIEELLKILPVKLLESDISVLGMIIDADTDLQARWDSITLKLITAGYMNVKEKPDENGTILMPPLDSLLPKVGIWIMPNNKLSGMLEDFLQFLIPEKDVIYRHAKESITALPEKRFSNAHSSKVLMHTWLAWQQEPGKPYGQAITARYLDTDLPLGQTFASWLRNTFFDNVNDS